MLEILKDIEINTNPGKDMPIYEQVAEHLRRKISSDCVSEGMRLPAISEMMKEWNIAYPTIKTSLEILENEGLIRSEAGRGRGAVIINKLNNHNSGENSTEISSKTLSMIFCGLEKHITMTPIYSRLLYGLERGAEEMGYDVVISSLKDPQNFQNNKIYTHSAGFVALGSDFTGMRQLFEGKPFVWVMGRDKNWADHLTYNNLSVGILAAEYALKSGFRSFASFDIDPLVGAERHKTFVNNLKIANKTVIEFRDYNALIVGKFEQHIDLDIIEGWVGKVIEKSKPPIALFLSAEIMVAAVHNMLTRKGLIVGKDVVIIACSAHNISNTICPEPIEIDLCAEEVGRLAANHLLWRIQNPQARRIVLKLEPEINGRLPNGVVDAGGRV